MAVNSLKNLINLLDSRIYFQQLRYQIKGSNVVCFETPILSAYPYYLQRQSKENVATQLEIQLMLFKKVSDSASPNAVGGASAVHGSLYL